MLKRAALYQKLGKCIGAFVSCGRTGSSFGDPAGGDKPLDRLTVLYAEDDLLTRKLTTHRLMSAGARVVEAETGLAALEKLDVAVFDFLLLDLDMPELDGVATAQRLCRDPEFDLPIFILTSNVSEARIAQARAAGVASVFSKPLPIEPLAAAIAELGVGRRTHDLQASNAGADTSRS